MSFNHKRRAALAATIVLAVAGSAAGWTVSADSPPPAAAPAAPEVDVAVVGQQEITEWQSYSGRLEAVQRAEIRPQVSGILTAVHFKDGSLVKKGDALFTIDPRPFAAEVARAEAQLAAADSKSAYSSNELARGERLLADNAIARREFEEKQNAAREAQARLREAKAALQLARLNLEYTQITAPISGRISRAEVTVGGEDVAVHHVDEKGGALRSHRRRGGHRGRHHTTRHQDHQGRSEEDHQDQGQVQVQVLRAQLDLRVQARQEEVEGVRVAEEAEAAKEGQAQLQGPRH